MRNMAVNSWHKILAPTVNPNEAPSLPKFLNLNYADGLRSSSVCVNPLRSSEGEAGALEGAARL